MLRKLTCLCLKFDVRLYLYRDLHINSSSEIELPWTFKEDVRLEIRRLSWIIKSGVYCEEVMIVNSSEEAV